MTEAAQGMHEGSRRQEMLPRSIWKISFRVSQRVPRRGRPPVGFLQEQIDQGPLGISQISLVRQPLASVRPPRGRRPHFGFRPSLSTDLEARHIRLLNPFRGGLLGH